MFALIPSYWPRNSDKTIPRDSPRLKTHSSEVKFEVPLDILWPSSYTKSHKQPALPKLDTHSPTMQLQTPSKHLLPSSQPSTDELFFDCLTPSPTIRVTSDEGESSSNPYVLFEPAAEGFFEREPTEWRRYEPPKELLQFQGNPLETRYNEIRRVVPESIERIRERHLEEENKRRAAGRPEKPLSRSRRISTKPRSEVSQLKSAVFKEY